MTHFAVLWSFFEARVFDTALKAAKVQCVAQQWVDDGRLDIRPFREALSYFQWRYVASAVTNDLYAGLSLRKNDDPSLVKKVLLGQSRSEVDVVAAMLIIVYRLRNNLFHGLKWSDEIRGQLDNFTHANNLMMAALDITKYSPFGDELQSDA